MKFNKIKIEDGVTKIKGVSEINIQRLTNVIALVGKNGSGKSRILDLIDENLFRAITIPRILDGSISHLPKQIGNFVTNLIPFKDFYLTQEKVQELTQESQRQPPNEKIKQDLQTAKLNLRTIQIHPTNQTQINQFYLQFPKLIAPLKQNYFRRINNEEIRKLQQVIADTKGGNNLLFESLIESTANNAGYDEFKSINRSALKYLAKLPNKLTFDYMDCLGDAKKYEARVSHKRYISLKKLVQDFLNKDLTWEKKSTAHKETETGVQSNYSGIWKINEREFNYTEFSDGEKTLFAYALLFFLLDQNPKLNIKESIILIDEPELHLHPDSEIDLINGIRNAIGETGQLIIATHSINILSTLNYEEIFMVKDGVIKHPTQTTPSESLAQLMGIEDRVNKLSDFLTSISTWTYVNFMAQCFSNPEVIQSARQNDPQIEAFKKAIRTNLSKQTNMLLDFGAGKGRLYEQIKSDFGFIDKINYSALEPKVEFHPILSELGATQVFKSYTELPDNSFDFILLCNVLHEIPLDEWEANLNKVINSLKPNGYLIIIEAKALNKGEKIGKIGYLLLDIAEIQQLFKLSKPPSEINVESRGEGIACAVINKSDMKEISRTDILNCLIALETNTLKKIESLRGKNYNDKELYGLGRKSAFLSQQHINARFAREHIQNN